VPLLIGSIKPCSMSNIPLVQGLCMLKVAQAYRAMITTAGGRPIAMKRQRKKERKNQTSHEAVVEAGIPRVRCGARRIKSSRKSLVKGVRGRSKA